MKGEEDTGMRLPSKSICTTDIWSIKMKTAASPPWGTPPRSPLRTLSNTFMWPFRPGHTSPLTHAANRKWKCGQIRFWKTKDHRKRVASNTIDCSLQPSRTLRPRNTETVPPLLCISWFGGSQRCQLHSCSFHLCGNFVSYIPHVDIQLPTNLLNEH